MSTLEDWTAAVVEKLELDPHDVDRDLVLDLARDVAHGVARPAAPLTAFLVGLAAGRTGRPPREVAAQVSALAASWDGGGAET